MDPLNWYLQYAFLIYLLVVPRVVVGHIIVEQLQYSSSKAKNFFPILLQHTSTQSGVGAHINPFPIYPEAHWQE